MSWQDGEGHVGGIPARTCTPSAGESNAPSDANSARPVPGAPVASKKNSAAAIELFPVDMSFTFAAIRTLPVCERSTRDGIEAGEAGGGPSVSGSASQFRWYIAR